MDSIYKVNIDGTEYAVEDRFAQESISQLKIEVPTMDEFNSLKEDLNQLSEEMASVSSSGISAADATEGQVPTADGKGGWSWENQNGGSASGTDGITPHIGENGNWYIGDTDTGRPSRGEPGRDGATPQRGVDYWTDADKIEIKSYVDEAILGGAW